MKPGPNYKLGKMQKLWLANTLDPHRRGMLRRSYIQAELYAAEMAKHQDKKKQKASGSEDD